MNLRKQAILLVLCPWLFQVVLGLILVPQLYKSQAQIEQRLHNEETLTICGELANSIGNAGIMAGSSRSPIINQREASFDTLINQVKTDTAILIARLNSSGYDPDFVRKIQKLSEELTVSITESRRLTELAAQSNSAALEPFPVNPPYSLLMLKMAALGRQVTRIMNQEIGGLATDKEQIRAEESQWRSRAIAIAACGLLVSIALSAFIIFRLFNELRALNRSIASFAAADIPERRLKGKSELASLERTVYDMGKFTFAAIERNKALVNNAAAMVCALDNSANFLTVNNYCRQLLGYEPDELIGGALNEITENNDYKPILKLIKAAMNQSTSQTFELRLRGADGTIKDSEWTVLWSKEDAALFCVVTDAGERRQLERLKEDFLAMISHDLRTPLMSIVTGLATLNHVRTAEKESFSVETRAQLAQAEAQITGLIVLVNNLLDFEKMQAGRMVASAGKVKIADLLVKAVDAVSERAEKKKIDIEISREASRIRYAQADEALLGQMLSNLLNLAVEGSNGGSILIDMGRIDNELEVRIMAPLDGQRLMSRPDTGEKLAIEVCKLIARAHQSELKIRLFPQAGRSNASDTCFSFTVAEVRL
jgi:PAS domain S-box-containing protein